MRRVDTCELCGESRELATRSPARCFMCYRREERERERNRQARVVDRHNPGLRREHKRLIRGFALVMSGLADLGLSRDDLLTVRQHLKPYLEPVAAYLAGDAKGEHPCVNSERDRSPVHRSHDADELGRQAKVLGSIRHQVDK